MRTTAWAAGAWSGAAVLAMLVGLLALTFLRDGINGTDGKPITQAAAARQLAGATRQQPAPSRTPSPSSATTSTVRGAPAAPPSVTRSLAVTGGTVLARCTAGQVRVLSWMPDQGFEVDDVDRGGGGTASLSFESDDVELQITVACRRGQPVAQVEPDD